MCKDYGVRFPRALSAVLWESIRCLKIRFRRCQRVQRHLRSCWWILRCGQIFDTLVWDFLTEGARCFSRGALWGRQVGWGEFSYCFSFIQEIIFDNLYLHYRMTVYVIFFPKLNCSLKDWCRILCGLAEFELGLRLWLVQHVLKYRRRLVTV